MIWFADPAKQELLPRLVGKLPPHVVPIRLRLQQRRQIDAGPHLLTHKLTIGSHLLAFVP